MSVHQSYPYDSLLFARRPSLLRIVGEAIISWADAREAAHAERARHRALQNLPSYLRQDLGLQPLDIRPSHWDR